MKEGQDQQGFGRLIYKNGDFYLGYFKDFQFEGQGKYTYFNGTEKEGIWKNGKFIEKN